jgi:hypothetical protein
MLIHRPVFYKEWKDSKLTSITIANQHLIQKSSYDNQRSFGSVIDSDSEALICMFKVTIIT